MEWEEIKAVVQVTFWGALGLLGLFFLAAIVTGSVGAWMLFGFNFLLLIIGAVANYDSYAPVRAPGLAADQNRINNEYHSEQEIIKGIEEKDPEILFRLGLSMAKESESEDDIKRALALICYASERGYQPAIELIAMLSEE